MASLSHTTPPLLISDPNKLCRQDDSASAALLNTSIHNQYKELGMPAGCSSSILSQQISMQDFYSTFLHTNKVLHQPQPLLTHRHSPTMNLQGLNYMQGDQCVDLDKLLITSPAATSDDQKQPSSKFTHTTSASLTEEKHPLYYGCIKRSSGPICKADEKRAIKRTKSGDSALTSEPNVSSTTRKPSSSTAACDSSSPNILSRYSYIKQPIHQENKNANQSIIIMDASNSKPNSDSDNIAPTNGSSKPEFIHVRARRGQATDSHSLAERVRREKISERMKYLQDLVPGCVKVTGKAMMLDEIINYVQSLQKQVEFLSMKLAAVPPNQLEFSLENFFCKKDQVVQSNIQKDDGNLREAYSPRDTEQGNQMQDLCKLMSLKDENPVDGLQQHQLSPITTSAGVPDPLQAANLQQRPCSSSDFMANFHVDHVTFTDRTDTYSLGGNTLNGAGLRLPDESCMPHADMAPPSGLAEWDDELQDMVQQLGVSSGYHLFAQQLLNEGSFF